MDKENVVHTMKSYAVIKKKMNRPPPPGSTLGPTAIPEAGAVLGTEGKTLPTAHYTPFKPV